MNKTIFNSPPVRAIRYITGGVLAICYVAGVMILSRSKQSVKEPKNSVPENNHYSSRENPFFAGLIKAYKL